MKKTLLIFVLSLFFAGLSKAQTNIGLTIGPQFISSEGFTATGFGANAMVKFNVSDNLRAGGNLGFNSWSGVNVIPITGSIEYLFGGGNSKFYLGTDLGAYILSANVEGFSASATRLGIAPYAGFDYSFSDNLAFTSNLK